MKAAQGVKIIAKDFEKALAGLPVYVSHGPEETEIWKVRMRERHHGGCQVIIDDTSRCVHSRLRVDLDRQKRSEE